MLFYHKNGLFIQSSSFPSVNDEYTVLPPGGVESYSLSCSLASWLSVIVTCGDATVALRHTRSWMSFCTVWASIGERCFGIGPAATQAVMMAT